MPIFSATSLRRRMTALRDEAVAPRSKEPSRVDGATQSECDSVPDSQHGPDRRQPAPVSPSYPALFRLCRRSLPIEAMGVPPLSKSSPPSLPPFPENSLKEQGYSFQWLSEARILMCLFHSFVSFSKPPALPELGYVPLPRPRDGSIFFFLRLD